MIELQHRLSKAYIVIFKSLAIRLLYTPKSDLPLSCNGFVQSSLAIPAFAPLLLATASSSASFTPLTQSILNNRRFSSKITQNFNVTASTASAKAVATPSVQSFLAIMTAERTGKSANSPPDQSLLPQTGTHLSKPVDPRQNTLILSDEPFSQSRLTKACVRAFSHSQASPKPSQFQTPL